jgi:transposase
MRKGPRKELSIFDRGCIVGGYRLGVKPAAIARVLGFPPSTVYTTISRYKKTGSAESRARPGRPLSLNARSRRVLKRIVLARRRWTLGQVTNEVNARLNTKLSSATVRKYMTRDGISSRKASKKPLVGKKTPSSDDGGVGSTENGFADGGRWSFPMSRAFASSTPTGERRYGAESESDITPTV